VSAGKVVTWQSPSGDTLDICLECEVQLAKSWSWPKDRTGQDYCQVSHGLHRGECEAQCHDSAVQS
jgi:hypothetical protein